MAKVTITIDTDDPSFRSFLERLVSLVEGAQKGDPWSEVPTEPVGVRWWIDEWGLSERTATALARGAVTPRDALLGKIGDPPGLGAQGHAEVSTVAKVMRGRLRAKHSAR